ncbi:major Facilitator Superfamily protein [Collimonas fungivorans]|uniref:Major Facilitator Superfamily protein n=1 Tax=Collimonas fungivorans TaxID=158899 RepID=A0A127PBW8_9BURK|nr:MFS transporter [Collimonas fungivorans]AMO94931.1 major Facilitator Superfamily protein [Collimonas fungivorans]
MTTPASASPESESVLSHRPFTLFWGARVASTIANQMQIVAVGWQVYQLTHSAFDLGMVGLVQFLPALFLALLVGHVADRYDRRKIARICLFIKGLAAAALAIGSIYGWLDKQAIFAIVFVIGATHAFESPTLQALVPGLVPARLLPRAVAWSASATQTAVIIGPALGGFIYVLGPSAVYTSSSVLFVGASLLVSLIRIESVLPRREPATLSSLLAGIAFIKSRPAILGAISLDLFAVLLGGATALLPIYAHDILATGPLGLGLLRSAPAVGALSTAIFLARRPLSRRVGRSMFIAVAVFGVATIVFALSRSFVLSLATLVVLGASDMISVVVRSSFVQLETPDHMRGRVSAVNSVFIGTSNQLGEFESGVTAAWLGPVPAVLLGGVGTVVVVLLWIRLFPTLFGLDKLVNPAAAPNPPAQPPSPATPTAT